MSLFRKPVALVLVLLLSLMTTAQAFAQLEIHQPSAAIIEAPDTMQMDHDCCKDQQEVFSCFCLDCENSDCASSTHLSLVSEINLAGHPAVFFIPSLEISALPLTAEDPPYQPPR